MFYIIYNNSIDLQVNLEDCYSEEGEGSNEENKEEHLVNTSNCNFLIVLSRSSQETDFWANAEKLQPIRYIMISCAQLLIDTTKNKVI